MTDQHQGNTLDDIADRIGQLPGSILDFDEPNEPEAAPSEEDEAAPQTQENSPPEQEATEPEAGEEEETEKTDEDEKPEEEEEPEKDESASEDDDPVYEVTLPDGKTEEVPVSALADGYLKAREVETIKAEAADMRRDYERRIQEIPAYVQQAVRQEQDRLAQSIQQWAQANPEIPVPSIDMLDPNSPDYNPDEFHRLKEQRELRKAKAQEAAHELQAIAQQREQERQERRAQEHEKLKAAWPELLSDSATQAAFFKQVRDYYGFDESDLRALEDHRAFLALRDGVGYREMKAKAPEVRQKVKAPKPKPVKAGTRKTASETRKADTAEQHKRLRKTGRPEDAMALLEGRLNL